MTRVSETERECMSPFEQASIRETAEHLWADIADLPPRLAHAMTLRCVERRTLRKVGDALGVQSERARQIESQAICTIARNFERRLRLSSQSYWCVNHLEFVDAARDLLALQETEAFA